MTRFIKIKKDVDQNMWVEVWVNVNHIVEVYEFSQSITLKLNDGTVIKTKQTTLEQLLEELNGK
jgi:hypothetical protein